MNEQVPALPIQYALRPHFIFNAMNAIQHFINNNQNELANRYLTDFGKMLRYNINQLGKEFILLEDELNYVELYLSFESLRFKESFAYKLYVDPSIDIDEMHLPVNVLVPVLEHIIWHNLVLSDKKADLTIKVNKGINDMLMVTITDDGLPYQDANVSTTESFKHVMQRLENNKPAISYSVTHSESTNHTQLLIQTNLPLPK